MDKKFTNKINRKEQTSEDIWKKIAVVLDGVDSTTAQSLVKQFREQADELFSNYIATRKIKEDFSLIESFKVGINSGHPALVITLRDVEEDIGKRTKVRQEVLATLRATINDALLTTAPKDILNNYSGYKDLNESAGDADTNWSELFWQFNQFHKNSTTKLPYDQDEFQQNAADIITGVANALETKRQALLREEPVHNRMLK